MADRIIRSINDLDMSDMTLPLITLYARPSDYPDRYVARVWEGKNCSPTNTILLYNNIEDAEKELGIYQRLERRPEDDPCIVCTYLP